MLLKGFNRTTAIGLDLGETAPVRAAQLRRAGEGWKLTALGHVFRTQAAAGASPSRAVEIDRLLKSASFRGRSVVTALNPPEVEFHVLDVPKAAIQDVANSHQVIHWEIGRLTSLSTDQIETRHWLLPSRQGATASAIGVSVTRDTVKRLLRICSESRLSCASVDTGATAIHRFGTMLRHWPQDEIWGLLDLGARQSRLVLSLGETPILIRHVGSGGQAWTERITETLQISASAAEIQKQAHGIALAAHREGRRSPESASHDEVAVMLLGALRGELNEMATEIKRSYEYVLGSYLGKLAGDLVLVGGGAAMPNLAEFLGGVLGIPVRPASQYLSMPECRLKMDASTKDHVEDFAVAIGLAIQEQEFMTAINLIPHEIEMAHARRRHWKRWSVIVTASAVLATIPIAWRISQNAQTARLSDALLRVESERTEVRAKLTKATARASELSSELERSRAFRSKRSWSGVVALLSAALPPDCWLISLATDPEAPMGGGSRPAVPTTPSQANGTVQEKVVIEAPRKLRMTGYSTSDSQPLTFVANLKESKAFSRVALQKAIRAPGATPDETLYQFEVVCEW